MSLKKSAFFFGLSVVVIAILTNYFSPENIHPALLLVLFFLIYISVFYLGIIAYHIYVNLSRMVISRGELIRIEVQPPTQFKKLNFVFSILAVMLLAMQSLKNVSFYEIILFIIIFLIAAVYVIKIK